jgi:hypothetical protein
MHDSYTRFPNSDEQNAYLSNLIRSFWKTVRTGELDGPALAEALSKTVRTQHFKLWTHGVAQQRRIEGLGADGWIPAGQDNVQMVFSNNYSVNKVDYYLRRAIQTDVQLNDDGSARVTTSATITNDAPPGPASLLLGPGIEGDPPGLNRMLLNFLMPRGSFVESFTIDGESTFPIEYRDGAFPVAGYVLEVPAGETLEATVVYSMPDAVERGGESDSFSLTLLPQALVNPDHVSLSVAAANNLLVRDPIESEGVASSSKTFSSTLSEEFSVKVTVVDDLQE